MAHTPRQSHRGVHDATLVVLLYMVPTAGMATEIFTARDYTTVQNKRQQGQDGTLLQGSESPACSMNIVDMGVGAGEWQSGE